MTVRKTVEERKKIGRNLRPSNRLAREGIARSQTASPGRTAGERIAARGGKSAKKRAVIAVARKLAVTLLALWKTGADYRAFPQPLPQAA